MKLQQKHTFNIYIHIVLANNQRQLNQGLDTIDYPSYTRLNLSMQQPTLQQPTYPSIDINPLYIQYTASFIIILLLNLTLLYQLATEMWDIYQTDNPRSVVHDIYDKIILHTATKYVIVNLLCIICFHNLTSTPVQLMRIFWLYTLSIVFMKFDIKDILLPSIYLAFVMIALASLWVWVYEELPAFKIIFILTACILYYGITQTLRITKILSSADTHNTRRQQLSINTLLQHHQPANEFGQQSPIFTQLDEHIIPHLQNRRSFCLVFCTVLFIDTILLMDLSVGKELLGQVFMSIALDMLPLYVVYWYLRKSGKEKQAVSSSRTTSIEQLEFNAQPTVRKSSNILIEMVNLKS